MSELINKKIHITNVIVFCILMLLGGVASLAMKKNDVSEMENRKLASFPPYSDSALWSGKYFKNIENFYADNFPFRDKWIAFSSQFKSKLGFQSSEIQIYNPVNETDVGEKQDTTKEKIADGPLPDDGAIGEVKKRVFVFKNRAFEMFGGGPAMGKSYANVINSYSRSLPGVQVYNLIIPVALEFEITEKYAKLQKPNRPAIENIYNSLDSNIKKVWAIDEIRKHRSEYIYFNTDHHWTSLGAYYAYRAFCQTAGLVPVSLDTIAYKEMQVCRVILIRCGIICLKTR